MRISLQNPFSFFGIDEFEKNQNNNQFFDGDKSDPRLCLENPFDDDDDERLVTEVRNNPRRPPLSSDDEDDGDEDDDDNEDDDAVSNGGVVQTESVEALGRSEDDNMGVNSLTSPTQVSQDSSSLINTPPPTRRLPPPPTLAEKLNKLIQVNLDGMTCRCHIFETTFATNYSGSDSGTVAEAILSAVLTSMEEALNNSFHELKILPISDDTYKQQNRWIRNSAELRNKIPSYRALSLYCDMEYGNSPYAAINSKPGEKKLRTRMRVGFARDTSEEAVQDYLHTGLRSQGRGAGCYPSPLQYGDIVKVGCFAFIPPEVNFEAYAKEIMRHFDFSIPIGIKMDWVSTPYTGRAKFNKPKPDFPFAAPATFISDWKSAQQGLISVKAYGPVKDATLTLISKLCDYYILTEVLYSVMDLPGMFKFATTTMFGSCTFFKLLLSIKATPAQADKASHTHQSTTETDDSDDDSDDDSSDDNPNESSGSKVGQFTEVWSKKAATKVKKKAKKKKKLITDNENPFLNNLSPAQRKMAEVADRKLKNDQERHKSGPLFLMVLPGEMEGTYILVCRKKFGQLARNFLKGLVPFLTHHLYEPTLTKTDQALHKWVPQSEISMARRKNLKWCTNTLRAVEATASPGAVEEALEFLDDVMEDATDVYDGQLSIDLDMANNKDIDDGKTVTGMMDEMQEREQQLEDAFNEIEIQDNALEAQERALAQQRADNATLQAQLAALQSQASHLPTMMSQPSPTLPHTNRVSPDRQALTPPVRSSNRTLGKSSTGQSTMVPNTVTQPKKATKQGKPPKQPAKKARFQEPSSAQSLAASAVQVDTSHMEGDNTTTASQDESQTSSLTASTPRDGGSPFVSPPSGKAHSDGAKNGNDSKQQQINSWLKEERVGIALLAEAKMFWPSINEGHGWSDRLRQATMKSEQKGFYSSVAYNWHQDRSAATSAVQWGGFIATVLNQVAHRAMEAGRDPTGLGRWAYVCLQGRKLKAHGGNVQDSLVEVNDLVCGPISKDLVVVSAYRPNKQGLGGSTVWAQHRLHFHAVNRKVNPRKAFVDDLCKQITKWRDEGCEVVLGIDANEDVTVNAPQSIRHRFQACGLEEAILKHHPPQATHQRNQRNIPIDGILTTSGVPILAGGYYAFDKFFNCNHRGLWIDIDLSASNLRNPTSSHGSCPSKTLDLYANIFNWFTKVMPSTPSRRD
ncbi:unnamed protein product [Cylindrotheca closterium]|uniref:Uncharacterized protein n=1 Tax=Cylindrotheca closterium TaxID=2856 RepID=A0AAD2FTG4_9STRA|nr:unnamed protein product [Cylindrotheca closterium]